MKILKLFLTASFFISLLAGFSAGEWFFNGKNEVTQRISPDKSYPIIPIDQENIWLIAVDRINISKPKIEGIWLLAYIPNYTTIKPLPLFPSNNSKQDAEITSAFSLTSDHKIAQQFWDFLKKHGHPAHDYILFDEEAAISIINIYGGVSIQGKNLTGLEALQKIPKTWNNPQESLRGQVIIMDSICKSIFNKRTVPNMDLLHKDIGNHISSNLDLGEKSQEWQKMLKSGSNNVCDFTDIYEKTHLTTNP